MKNLRKWLQYLGLTLGGIILFFQVRNGVITLQQRSIQLEFTFPLLLAFVAVIGAILTQMFAWSYAMKSLGVSLHAYDVTEGYLLSFLPRYIPGTVWGYISRSEWLFQQHGIGYTVSNQGSIVETLAAIVANMMIVALFLAWNWINYRILLIVAVLLLPLVIWALFQQISRIRLNRFLRINTLLRILFPVIQLKHWLSSVLLFFIVWLLYGIALLLIVCSLNGTPLTLSLPSLITYSNIYALAWLVGFLVLFVPAGLGVRELALTSLLTNLAGTTAGLSSIIAIWFRITILLSEIFLLGLSVLLKKPLSLRLLLKPLIALAQKKGSVK